MGDPWSSLLTAVSRNATYAGAENTWSQRLTHAGPLGSRNRCFSTKSTGVCRHGDTPRCFLVDPEGLLTVEDPQGAEGEVGRRVGRGAGQVAGNPGSARSLQRGSAVGPRHRPG